MFTSLHIVRYANIIYLCEMDIYYICMGNLFLFVRRK
nr:MAG TPA: hypothetical protein [Caudoviricetes sp.]